MRHINGFCTGYIAVGLAFAITRGEWVWAAAFAVGLAAGIANMCSYTKEGA